MVLSQNTISLTKGAYNNIACGFAHHHPVSMFVYLGEKEGVTKALPMCKLVF
jgi:hypothetical protein